MILLFIVNTPEFFLSHRLQLAISARRAGFRVHVATGPGLVGDQIRKLGLEHHLLPLSRSGKNPFLELHSLWKVYWLMRKIRPDLVHLVTVKPVLYGGLIARFSRVPAVVAAISGLGTVFVAPDRGFAWLRLALKWLYRIALGHPNIKVIFQNLDDRSLIIDLGAVREAQTVLIRGSGIFLSDYRVLPEPEDRLIVTLAARLLRDKGVREFVDAARILKARGVVAEFWLAGAPDPENLSSIPEAELTLWRQEGLVTLLGYRNDIADLFNKSNIIVLPSYREGFPKVLIEAAASARAVVTTDVPGCRDAIEPGLSGLLVPAQNSLALADALHDLIVDTPRRQQMGAAGRALAERKFAIEEIVNLHLAIYRELISAGNLR